MNILYLTNHLNVGGITSYALSLIKGMKGIGHNVYIASSGGQLLSRFTDDGINFIPIPIKTKQEVSLKIFLSRQRLLGVLKKYNIDILHSNSRTTQVLGCLLNRKSGVPHITTAHGFFKPKIFRRLFPCWGDRVIAISQQVKEHLVQDFKVAPEIITVIHNGIDIERFKNKSLKAKADFGLKSGPVIGIIARLSDVKGHIYLIEAMKYVLEEISGAQLLIVGEGKMYKELVGLVQRLEIEKNVVFMPEAKDTRDVLAVSDLFAMPSLKEGLGLALMEAMAYGVAVIGSGVGGIKSLIQDGKNGLLVEPANSRMLADKILELLKDPLKRKSLGASAQEFIALNFSQDKMVRETEGVYLECLNKKD